MALQVGRYLEYWMLFTMKVTHLSGSLLYFPCAKSQCQNKKNLSLQCMRLTMNYALKLPSEPENPVYEYDGVVNP